MSTTTVDADARAYLDAVAEHLSDLPESERRDLLDDLHQHLREVAAEGTGSLRERLGPPDAYARELRASADLPVRGTSQRLVSRIERMWPVRAIARARTSDAWRILAERAPELQPGWWALRGYLIVAMAAVLTHDGYSPYYNGRATISDVFAPYIFGSRAAGIMAGVFAVWVSYEVGRRSRTSAGMRRISVIATIAALSFTIAAIDAGQSVVVRADDDPQSMVLQHADGAPIMNICPYDADGTLLSDVLLSDQDGRAIRNIGARSEFNGGSPPAGATIENAYPQPLRSIDPTTGEVTVMHCPTVRALQRTEPATP